MPHQFAMWIDRANDLTRVAFNAVAILALAVGSIFLIWHMATSRRRNEPVPVRIVPQAGICPRCGAPLHLGGKVDWDDAGYRQCEGLSVEQYAAFRADLNSPQPPR